MLKNCDSKHLLIAAGVGVATVAAVSAIACYHHKKNAIPKRWIKVGELSELICYPIKSCGPIRIDQVNCTILGIENELMRDRVFMVTKTDGNFITARAYPIMVKVQPKIEGDRMILSAPGMMDIAVNITDLKNTPSTSAVVWDESVESIDCGEEIAKWLSRFILSEDTGLRLMYYPSKVPTRGVREKNKKFELMKPNDTGALHDASSYMLINESSIIDLNTKLEEKVQPLRFRPNFVVKGASPYAEDDWKWVKIGYEVVLRNVKPCTRCVFTNIDEETGKRNTKLEPLTTLKKYRLFEETGDSPVMGVHLGVRVSGKINLGDSVYVPA